jgi:hypothetical protein
MAEAERHLRAWQLVEHQQHAQQLQGLILDLAYIPFSHGAPGPYDYKTWNARIGVQFIEYLHVYGGSTNFDGSYLGGTHNASGNNSVFAYAWLAF